MCRVMISSNIEPNEVGSVVWVRLAQISFAPSTW